MLALAVIFTATSSPVAAQEYDKNEIIKETRAVDDFHGIEVGGIFNVLLTQGSHTSVEIETTRKYMEKVTAETQRGILHLSGKSIRKPKKLNVYITAEEIDRLNVSGAANLEGQNTIRSETLKVTTSGAADANLDVEVKALTTQSSGASGLKITGSANIHYAETSGASSLTAHRLRSNEARVTTSGASDAKINTAKLAQAHISGASTLENHSGNKTVIYGPDETTRLETRPRGDTSKSRIGRMNIEVVDNDSTQVSIGKHRIVVNENGHVKYSKWPRKKFNGHWAGVELGVNGYLTPGHNMDFGKEYEYLDLRMEKSLVVNMNVFEQNFSLSRSNKFGVLTGLGFSSHNYRFNHPTTLTPDSSEIAGFLDKGIQVRKSKLVVNYITVPLIFEFQTNRYCKTNSFHIAAGAVLGIRFASHTKKYYDELNKEYTLTEYNPATGRYEDVYITRSPGESIAKNRDDFHLNPFKAYGTFRIGWGFVNLFANYSFTTLFRENKGPELYPYEVGITLLGW